MDIKEFEYRALEISWKTREQVVSEMNLLGMQGWELVCGMFDGMMYFKREKISDHISG